MLITNFKNDIHNFMEREPYQTLTHQFKKLETLNDGEIEIQIASENNDFFSNGFWIDQEFMKNPKINFYFSKSQSEENMTIIQMACSFGLEDANLGYLLNRMRNLKKRIPYIYFPFICKLDFGSNIEDDRLCMVFSVTTEEINSFEVCCHLVSLLIEIFALDD